VVPEIYEGDLRGLEQAIHDAQRASCKTPGTHKVSMHDPLLSEKVLIRVFSNGEVINTEGDPDA